MSLTLAVPVHALSTAGITLPAAPSGEPQAPTLADLAGSLVVDPDGTHQRLVAVHRHLETVTALRWKDIDRASTGLLPDGRVTVMLLSGVAAPLMEVLALIARPSNDGPRPGYTTFSRLLGDRLARAAAAGTTRIADGDLAWLSPRLDPCSDVYFRN